MKIVEVKKTDEVLYQLKVLFGMKADIEIIVNTKEQTEFNKEYMLSLNPFVIGEDGKVQSPEEIEKLKLTAIETPYGRIKIVNPPE